MSAGLSPPLPSSPEDLTPLFEGYKSVIPEMQRAADDVDACASRLGLNVEAAVSDHLFLVAQVLSVLSTASSHFHYNVNVQKRRRLAWMEKQEAELDSSRELLCSGAALCDGDVSDLATLLESVSVIASLGKCELTPRMPAWLRGGSAFELGVDDFARVSDGVLSGCITGPSWCRVGLSASGPSHNVMHVMCTDAVGDAVRGLAVTDFQVDISNRDGAHAGVCANLQLEGSTLSFTYAVSGRWTGDAVFMTVSLLGLTIASRKISVGGHIIGKLLRSHSLPGDDYRGLAASREGTHVALTSEDTGTVCVLSLPSLSPGFVFGGDGDAPGQFRLPQKLCFSPLRPDHLLVADAGNNRIQEVTVTGVPVRTIQVSSAFRAIDAHEHVCAIVLLEDRPEGVIMLYDLGPGDLITSFGRVGTNPWVNDDLILEASSVRFSPDGTQLAIAQDCQPVFRIALFTTGGDFIRNFGRGSIDSPVDVAYSLNGNILIAARRDCKIIVFSPEGDALPASLRSNTEAKFLGTGFDVCCDGRPDGTYGGSDSEPGRCYPLAMVALGPRLLVLCCHRDTSTMYVQEYA